MVRRRNKTLPGNPEPRSMGQHSKYAKHFLHISAVDCRNETNYLLEPPAQCTRLTAAPNLASFSSIRSNRCSMFFNVLAISCHCSWSVERFMG